MEQYTYIAHHGIRGMRWGVRNYQNEDGSLTALGRLRYGVGDAAKKIKRATTSARVESTIARNRASRQYERASEAARSAIQSVGNRVSDRAFDFGRFIGSSKAKEKQNRLYADAKATVRKLQAPYENLLRQRDYAKRVMAAKDFLRLTDTLKQTVEQASQYRFYNRGHVWGEAALYDIFNPSGPVLSGRQYMEYLRGRGSQYTPSDRVNDLFSIFKDNIDSHQRGMAGIRETAGRKWRIARGH